MILPGEDDPRRQDVRRWLEEHPHPTGRQLAEAGYVVPHWPKPWGLDADPEHQIVIDQELRGANVRRPMNPIGIGHCGPVLITHGSDEQKKRYVLPMLAGEELWCQLFSEPGAGSDLANVSTRAVRHGDAYVVNGSKIWTSLAQNAKFGVLLARTLNDVPKHAGLSYFLIPMDLAGIDIRPIIDMTGGHTFNEVFFADVRVPVEMRIGDEGRGWEMARTTLANERVSLNRHPGVQWGNGPSVLDLVNLVKARGGIADPVLRQRLMEVYIEGEIIGFIRADTVARAVSGRDPGPQASFLKCMNDVHGQKVLWLAKDLAGAGAMLNHGVGPLGSPGEPWARGFLFSPALTVGGGTTQVLKNVIAERLLALPRDIDVEAGKSWDEIHRAPARA